MIFKRFGAFSTLLVLTTSLSACRDVAQDPSCTKAPMQISESEALISILGTNDMHGSIQPKSMKTADGKTELVGGMAFWAGAAKAVREGVEKSYGKRGGVLVLDGGDQFQGTLLSNYSEGELFFSLMNDVGYDAVVPGNHDYDFGPAGWLIDQVTSDSADQDPRGVIKKLAASAKFPLLSANTYLRPSLKTIEGKTAETASFGCASNDLIDWSRAERPEFLKPYLIKEVAGVRVAIIGLDNPATAASTTAANVTDLCFRESAEEYKAIREELEGKADLFVITIHDGDINQDKNLSELLDKLLAWRSDAVDAIVGGHTHSINQVQKDGVYGIQSGANGERFGRIDLVVDLKTRKVKREKTRVAAGARLLQNACDPKIDAFCDHALGAPAEARPTYDCKPIVDSTDVLAKIDQAQQAIAPMAKLSLGFADAPIKRHRDNESPLLNFLTDAFRRGSGADIAMVNTGGIRTDIDAGEFRYENLYQISPFNNRAVILSPMTVPTLLKIFERSARSCGKYGAVLGSGVRVVYRRGDCKSAVDGMDPNAEVVTMELLDGTLLYDARDPANIKISDRTIRMATLDFLEAGGSGYTAFKEAPREADLGIFRELIVKELTKNPGKISAEIDGRFRNELAPAVK